MKPHRTVRTPTSLTAVILRKGADYSAHCPELDVASEGDTVEEAALNLREAVELFLESADTEEIARRTREVVHIARLDFGRR